MCGTVIRDETHVRRVAGWLWVGARRESVSAMQVMTRERKLGCQTASQVMRDGAQRVLKGTDKLSSDGLL